MSDEIAHGVINIEARDSEALASLRRVDNEYDRTMRSIDGKEAEVRIKGNISDLKRSLKEAEAEVKAHNDKIDTLEEKRANAQGAKKGALTREINQRKEIVSQLNEEITRGKTLQDGAEKHLSTMERTNKERSLATQREKATEAAINRKASAEQKYAQMEKKASEDRWRRIQQESRRRGALADQQLAAEQKQAQMEEKAAGDRWRRIQQEARRRGALSDQQARTLAADENAAHRMDANRDRDLVKVVKLQREYAKLSDRLENLNKRNAFTDEARIKLDLDQKGALAEMLVVKRELNALGSRPPVGIETTLDRKGLKNKAFGAVGDVFRKLAQGASGVSSMTVRLGPFTASIRQAIIALAAFGPLLVDLAGGAVALGGVLATAASGAAALGAGIGTGLLVNLLGLKQSLKPIAADFKINTQLVDAYHKAVLKFGKGSDQAQKAQDQMNNALKTMDPSARAAAKAAGGLNTQWQKLTSKDTAQAFNSTVLAGSNALTKLMPTLARNTNQASKIISSSLNNAFRGMSSSNGIAIFDSLGKSANRFLAPALSGLTHLGAAFGHIAEAAGRIFAGRAGNAFDKWTAGIDRATQKGPKLDATITRLGNHARDVGRLFMDFGRLMVTVFNGGADSGDHLVNQLDHAFRSWNTFLKSTQGKQSMATFFKRSADSVSSLAGALAPLAAAIGDWSNLISPFTRGILDAISFISRLFLGITKVIGLGGPLTALGATFATLWAVGKMAAFVAMLSRVVSLFQKARAAATFMAGVKTFAGGIGGALKGGGIAGGMLQASAAGSAEFRAAIISGATIGAAEMRTAMATGGAAAGAEGALGGGLARRASGLIVPAAAATSAEAAGAAASAASISFTGLAVAAGLVLAPITALSIGVGLLTRKTQNWGTSATPFIKGMQQARQETRSASTAYTTLRSRLGELGTSYAQDRISMAQARKGLAETKKGTLEHRQALLTFRQTQNAVYQDRQKWIQQTEDQQRAAEREGTASQTALDQNKRAILELQQAQKDNPMMAKAFAAQIDALRGKQQGLADQAEAAWNRMAAAPLNAQRAYRGMILLTGQAEQAMGKLARAQGGKQIAQKISLKYDDPAKAGRAASAAKNALQSGVGKGAVMRIITDSSSADQAIRRLQAARITPKKLNILESGGNHAISVLEAIIGRKLTKKEQKIAQDGGPAVIALLERIIGKKLPRKTQTLVQQGFSSVMGAMSNINSYVLHDKSFSIHIASDVMSGLASIQSAINSIHGKSVGVSVHRGKYAGGVVEPRAMGAGAMQRAAVAAEKKPFQRTRGGSYATPTLLVGEEKRKEYVIATNPAYRKNNKRYLMDAARDFGMVVVDAAAGGKGGGVAQKRPSTARHNHHPNIGPHKKLPLTSTDNTTSDFLSQYRANAVNAYNKEAGEVNKYDKQLEGYSNSYADTKRGKAGANARKTLGRKIARARKKRAAAAKRIPALRRAQNKAMHEYQTGANLQNKIETDTSLMNTAATWYNAGDPKHNNIDQLQAWKDAKGKREKAIGDLINLYTRLQKFAPARFQTDLTRLIAGANNDLAGSQNEQVPQGKEPDAAQTVDQFLAANASALGDLSALNRDYAVAQTNNVPDNPSTIYDNENLASLGDDQRAADALRTYFSNALGYAQSHGANNDIITSLADSFNSARDTAQGIADTISGVSSGGGTTTVGAQSNILSTARGDLMSQYGSNLSPVWAQPNSFPAAALAPAPTPGAYGTNPNTTASTRPTGTVVNQTINIAEPPPDPHTWSQGVAWELQSAI